jgi:drug/metabolite transporter (DMT)-like permease
VLAWGVNWSVTRQLVQFLPPLWSAAIRSWIALIGLAAMLGLSNNLVIPERRDIPVVLSVALLPMTLFSTLAAADLRFLPASKGIVLGYTTPLWVARAALGAIRQPREAEPAARRADLLSCRAGCRRPRRTTPARASTRR